MKNNKKIKNKKDTDKENRNTERCQRRRKKKGVRLT